jgi:hypothetical protein
MRYRAFGQTGLQVSRLGFGMRLPVHRDGNVNFDLALARIHQARAQGINFFDTMEDYYQGQSEIALGRAMSGHRSDYTIESKLGSWPDQVGKYRQRLEASLGRLQTNYVDILLFHNLHWDYFKKFEKEIVAMASRAKEEGLVRHVGFSSHDLPAQVLRLVDSGFFQCVLLQYNLMDPKWADCIDHAHAKGLGVSVMGPVGGGRLAQPIPAIQALLPSPGLPTHRLALRFVLSNPAVDVTLSGMQEAAFLEENVALACQEEPLSQREYQQMHAALEEKRELAKLYCTGCLYCQPCPRGVEIPKAFEYMIAHKIYGVTGWARAAYAALGGKASLCAECGKCEKKCPQHIPIRERLKEVVGALERPAPSHCPPNQAAMQGFHRDEGGWRWMGPKGAIRIPPVSAPGGVQLTFSLACAEAKAYPVFPFRVRLSVANKPVQDLTFSASNQSVSVALPVENQTPTELQLESEASFVPSQSVCNGDHRRLSVRISALALSARPNPAQTVAPPETGPAVPSPQPVAPGASTPADAAAREFLALVQNACASLIDDDAAGAQRGLATASATLAPESAMAKAVNGLVEVLPGIGNPTATPKEAALCAQRLVDLAQVLAQAGCPLAAQGFLQYALHHHPLSPPVQSLLGRRCLAQGRHREAIRPLTMAYALDPHDLSLLRDLALCYEKVDDARFADVIRKRAQTGASRCRPGPSPKTIQTHGLERV